MAIKRSSTLDIFKALACMGVVLIHAMFPENAGVIAVGIARYALPLFFCVSGYYLTDRGLSFSAVFRKFRHVLRLILVGEAFYGIFTFFYRGLWDPALLSERLTRYFEPGWLWRWLLTGTPPVFMHLWFLYSLGFLYLLTALFFSGSRRIKALSMITPILLLCLVALQEFRFLNLFPRYINVPGTTMKIEFSSMLPFRALTFFLIGVLFSSFRTKIIAMPVPVPTLVLLLVLFEVLAVYEELRFSNGQIYVSNIMTTLMVMCISIKKPDCKSRFLAYVGRRLCFYIYLFDSVVVLLMDGTAAAMGIAASPVFLWLRPVIALLITIGSSISIDCFAGSACQRSA